MAHNLNYNEQTGKYSFYSLKEKASDFVEKTKNKLEDSNDKFRSNH